jgi:hypothetical protein
VNLFQADISLDIFENVILPKMLYTYLTKVYTRSYCWNNGGKMIYIQVEPPLHLADSKETVIPLESRKL